MLIKKIHNYEKIPILYAPFDYDMSKLELSCTFIGLNIIFYFVVEFWYAMKGMGRLCKYRKEHDDKSTIRRH